jgi:hypothetical protein
MFMPTGIRTLRVSCFYPAKFYPASRIGRRLSGIFLLFLSIREPGRKSKWGGECRIITGDQVPRNQDVLLIYSILSRVQASCLRQKIFNHANIILSSKYISKILPGEGVRES